MQKRVLDKISIKINEVCERANKSHILDVLFYEWTGEETSRKKNKQTKNSFAI